MNAQTQTTRISTGQLWTARIMGGIGVLFMAFDTVIKLVRPPFVMESFDQLGYPTSVALGIGLVQAVCLIVYLVPRTAVLGAVLMTGYLGGAIATHVRLENPWLTHVLFPIYIAVLLWAPLYLRDERVRAVMPFRR